MAKRKIVRRKKTECPEPISTLLDLAHAFTLDYIAYKRRQKNGVKRMKVDPYAAAGVAFGLGKLESTEDILELGGMLGAMGAFDEAESVDEELAYRVNREDYETRDAYVSALNTVRFSEDALKVDEMPMEIVSKATTLLCRVSCLETGHNSNYHSEILSLRPGEQVFIPSNGEKTSIGVILTVDLLEGETATEAMCGTPKIIGRAT